MEKQFIVKYTPEAKDEFKKLDLQNQKRAFRTISVFEQIGRDGVQSRPLNDKGLFELKCDKIRMYFMYCENSIVIVGVITLKKSQKAPERYKETAMLRIQKYIRSENNG